MSFDNRNYNRGPGRDNRRDNRQERPPAPPIQALTMPADYLEQAEELMRQEARSITTSKIRRIYSLATDIYNEERLRTEETLSEESVSALGMMRIRIAYECGRDKDVKAFIQKAKLMEYLKGLGTQREHFLCFMQYMEAMVAYHKFFGGKENG